MKEETPPHLERFYKIFGQSKEVDGWFLGQRHISGIPTKENPFKWIFLGQVKLKKKRERKPRNSYLLIGKTSYCLEYVYKAMNVLRCRTICNIALSVGKGDPILMIYRRNQRVCIAPCIDPPFESNISIQTIGELPDRLLTYLLAKQIEGDVNE